MICDMCGEANAQYRKPTKPHQHTKVVPAVRPQPIQVVIPTNPYSDTIRLYQYAQFQLYMQFQYEQQPCNNWKCSATSIGCNSKDTFHELQDHRQRKRPG